MIRFKQFLDREVKVVSVITCQVPFSTISAMPSAQFVESNYLFVQDGGRERMVRCSRRELPSKGEFITVDGFTVTLLGHTIFTWYKVW